MESAVFGSCFATYEGDTDAVLRCVVETMENRTTNQEASVRSWLLTFAGTIIFLMQLGFAMLCAGCVRRKNVSNTLLKNVLDACGAAIAFFAVGYAFAFGGNNVEDGVTFLGSENFFLVGLDDFAFWFFQYCFAAATVTIIAGTLAERCKMSAYLCYSLFMVGFVYPVIAHALWSSNGFLSPFIKNPYNGVGCIDFAGSGVVHLTGGLTSLIAAIIMGPRKGRFTNSKGVRLDTPRDIPGHSVSLQAMGVLILWCGCKCHVIVGKSLIYQNLTSVVTFFFPGYGFNAGSALVLPNASNQGHVAGRAALNLTLSGAFAGITALLTKTYFNYRSEGELAYDLNVLLNGTMSGFVAITGGCATLAPVGAVVVGIIAAFIYMGSSHLLLKMRVDDCVDGVPIHLSNGMWGLFATGLLSSPDAMMEAYGSSKHVGWLYSMGNNGSLDSNLLVSQVLGILFICGFVTVTMTPFFLGLSYMNWLRVDVEKEIAGLDVCYMIAPQENDADMVEKVTEALRLHRQVTSSMEQSIANSGS